MCVITSFANVEKRLYEEGLVGKKNMFLCKKGIAILLFKKKKRFLRANMLT